MDIKSELVTLQSYTERNSFFNIPIYQRLYVWNEVQINTLLWDLHNAINEKSYYLGGIMLSKNTDNYDLIDGQQRFTTLWLIGYVLKNALSDFLYFIENKEKRGRITFSIRDFANEYFQNPSQQVFSDKDAEQELQPVTEALKTITRFFEENNISEEEKEKLSEFIFKKVQLIATTIPPSTDENRLFEVMNNRGVQLQHHEILKGELLNEIKFDEDYFVYAKLWEACSLMDEYIEKNIKEVAGLSWKELTFSSDEEEREVGLPTDIKSIIRTKLSSKNRNDADRSSLLKILTENKWEEPDENEEDYGYDSGQIRSIISFPMFLLHCLRVFLFKKQKEGFKVNNIEIKEKKMLQIFHESFFQFIKSSGIPRAELVKEFLDLLWLARVQFDKQVIKWVQNEDTERHSIKRLYLNKDALQRRELDTNEGFALLQSMLYHSQQIVTHYWLTPFLYHLTQNNGTKANYNYLRKLDNAMFCSNIQGDLRERSWELIGKDLNNIEYDINVLDKHKGTGYWSYWFYKLDFILWYYRTNFLLFEGFLDQQDQWNEYRMTAKNSVEHISPQNPKDYDDNLVWNEKDSVENKNRKINDFGNLVLLAKNINSEYSNKIFTVKKSEFEAKSKSKRIDSLKSALIFEHRIWSWEKCQAHREKMKDLFNKYLLETRSSNNNLN
ncbi:hypothetical protein ALGA_2514 [Labilibaculum antarcticum]|uniref:DUF262 domain-containing protein n=1 Tax=Labilibaculum antarcticum TaxID=1717717 RepID=A0A1Y1CKC1_9BACT|nr:hypothetical protein ALGA_2514 [Labilibaculum antarcticum]